MRDFDVREIPNSASTMTLHDDPDGADRFSGWLYKYK